MSVKIRPTISMQSDTLLVTGVAGFIGFHLVNKLLRDNPGIRVVGIDNMNGYYDVRLKESRLQKLLSFGKFSFIKGNIADIDMINDIFDEYRPDIVVNLAAQAGVRYSITNPSEYIESNIIGFYNILEACRRSRDNERNGVRHLVYASSSSVYGNNRKVPYSTDDKTDSPVSLYAATKKSDELMAYTYSVLYGIPVTGLRFFTVYGPAGRPDMAYFSFTDKLRRGKKIQLFNYGNCRRDFTYIDDVVEGICLVMRKPPLRERDSNGLVVPPYAIYNIGNSRPESLLEFINVLHQELIRAGVLPYDFDICTHCEPVAMQPGDVSVTFADVSALERDFGFKPSTPLCEGLRRFVEWYRDFYITGMNKR